jgi:hypothetical protein
VPGTAPGVIRRARQQISSGQAAEALARYRALGWAEAAVVGDQAEQLIRTLMTELRQPG